jgi:uncharacterized membrane protein YoaK (UPF0700 family)
VPYSHPQPLTREQALGQIRHLLPGALVFAGTAGFINSVALGVFRSPVSHMTGAVSYLGIELAGGRPNVALATLSIIVTFMIGAALSGFILGAENLSPGRHYGVALGCEGALLAIATLLLVSGHPSGVSLVSMACGVQNAMTSSYCGLMIRTTHVTGTVTDIGVMLGHLLRHRSIERRKLVLMIGLLTAFGAGVWVGALADSRWGSATMGFASFGCLVASAAMMIFSKRFK